MLTGKLSPQGVLTDVRQGPPTTWGDGSQDVPLSAWPKAPGPWGYDPQTQTATVLLATAKAARLASLDAWLAAKQAAGVTAGNYTLPATEKSQQRFTSLVTTHQLALSAGAETSSATVEVIDQSGATQTMTVSSFFAVMLSYSAAVEAFMFGPSGYFGLQAAVNAAADQAALDAVVFPA